MRAATQAQEMTTFLVVDDMAPVRNSMAAILEHIDPKKTTVLVAADSDAALRLFQDQRPDAVFMDLLLEAGRDGLAAIQRMRIESPRTPIVVFSALPADAPLVRQAVQAGPFAVLPKPATGAEIR